MAAEDCLRVELPPEFGQGAVSGLLDRLLPADAGAQREIVGHFDLRANPDLPDIYAVFLAVGEEWRDSRCALRVTSANGESVELDTPVSRLIAPGPDGSPLLALRLEQHYRALEYAVRQGLWESCEELLAWLRSLTALYYIDKHEVRLDAAGMSPDSAPRLASALDSLQTGLVSHPPGLIAPEDAADADGDETLTCEPPIYVITPEGRRFIAGLLAETESYIDLYDHFQDTAVDLDRELVEFGTGRGADLRVQTFLAEGLDPIRTVFLLRLYDGTLDARLRDWTEVIESDDYYQAVLEPVVNRDGVDPSAMELAIEGGYAWLEELQEQARREEQQREILRRASEGRLDC